MKKMHKHIHGMMQKAIDDNVFPGGVLLVSQNGAIRFFEACGCADLFSRSRMTKDTIFDLASLTKPLATTLAVMRLIQKDKITLEQKAGDILPQLKGGPKEDIQIAHLLGHCSGLPAYRPYYLELEHLEFSLRKPALRDLIKREPLAYPCGTKVLYSDLGFMLLSWIIETIAGRSLNRLVEEEIYQPLGLNLFFAGPHGDRNQLEFAATEKCPWRHRVLQGEVHDENAFVLGGVEGHAGLFGNATETYRLLIKILSAYRDRNTDTILTPHVVKRFLTRRKKIPQTLGFDTPSAQGSSSGDCFSENSVGHLGFTGTSFWMDLKRSIIIVLLTNRVHPRRANDRIKEFRPRLHNAVMRYLTRQGEKNKFRLKSNFDL